MEHDQHDRQRIEAREPQDFARLALIEHLRQVDVGHAVGTDGSRVSTPSAPAAPDTTAAVPAAPRAVRRRRDAARQQPSGWEGPSRGPGPGHEESLLAGENREIWVVNTPRQWLAVDGVAIYPTTGQTGQRQLRRKTALLPGTARLKIRQFSATNGHGAPGAKDLPCRRSSLPWPPIRAPSICDP